MTMPAFRTILLCLTALSAAAWPIVERGIGAGALRTPPSANPYDPDEIGVDVVIVLPDGTHRRQPAFWYVPMEAWTMTADDGKEWERFRPAGPGEWRFRFSPPLPGNYAWSWVVETSFGATVVDGGIFRVGALPPAPGPLRLADHGRGFALPDGRPWIAIGENMGWPNEGGSRDYAAWLPALADAGGNCARIWLTHYFGGTALEWSPTGVNDGYRGAGHYSQEAAARLDRIFALATENDIQLMVSLFSFGDTTWDWERHPYARAAGGWLDDPAEFWTDARARRHVRNLLRYLVARYGYSRYLWAWEFWNEMEAAGGYDPLTSVDWHRDMAATLRELDGGRHLISSSYTWVSDYGRFPVFRLEDIDFTQTHIYNNEPIAGIYWGLPNLDPFGKPALVGEAGLGVEPNYFAADPAGLNIHDMLWAGVMCGSAGGGLTWWWDNYVHPNDLYYHFTGISRAVAGLDPAGGEAVEMSIDAEGDWFALARRCTGGTIGWFGPRRSSRRGWDGEDYRVYLYQAPPKAKVERLHLAGDFSTVSAVNWIDPYDGVVIASEPVTGDAEGISLTPPSFRHDLAFVLGEPRPVSPETPLHDRFAAEHDRVQAPIVEAAEAETEPEVPAHGPGAPEFGPLQ